MSAPLDKHASEKALVVVFPVSSNHNFQGFHQLVRDSLFPEVAFLDLKIMSFHCPYVLSFSKKIHLVRITSSDLNVLNARL